MIHKLCFAEIEWSKYGLLKAKLEENRITFNKCKTEGDGDMLMLDISEVLVLDLLLQLKIINKDVYNEVVEADYLILA